MPKAVLLDLDDTILDDSSTVEQCWRDACAAHQCESDPFNAEEVYAAVRRAGDWFWSDPERHRVGRLDLDAARVDVVRLGLDQIGVAAQRRDDLAEKVARMYSRLRDSTMRPLPDAIETVRWLRERGLRLALITNGAGVHQRRKISRYDLAPLFDCILVEGEVGFGKPDERVYRRALRELAVEAEQAWMVGDHLEFDVAAPQKLGLFAVWIDAHGAGVPPARNVRPDRIVRALSELRSVNISPAAE